MGIAESVVNAFHATGQFAIPDGQKGIAVSFPMSSDESETRRSLSIVFEDGSNINVQFFSAQLNWAEAGDISLETLDTVLAGFKAATQGPTSVE